ncbi:MAG TPA: hypothetical protein VKV15_20480 [Bryobacteraceae bacterium]|nr:hypothetical protein [Bryobacteraceae bacterium]
MPAAFLTEIRQAITNLNPNEVREVAERPLSIGLVAPTQDILWQIESFLCPPELSLAKRAEISSMIHRNALSRDHEKHDVEIYDASVLRPKRAFPFDPDNPQRTVRQILDRHPELALPLSRHFPPFRQPVVRQIVHKVARENALFSLATALPDILPSLLSLPWAVGEFASDTAFLTMNQIRMSFLLAAASDRDLGYREQKTEVASIIAGAFGWRSLARELIGKIPLGGGLLPKAAVAYSGTYVEGVSLERLYRIGYGLTREERRTAYREAFHRGKQIAETLLETLRRRQAV